MDTLKQVRRLVERLEPTQVCGPCIHERIDGPSLDEVSIALSELAATREFERDNADCGLCGQYRLTIRRRR